MKMIKLQLALSAVLILFLLTGSSSSAAAAAAASSSTAPADAATAVAAGRRPTATARRLLLQRVAPLQPGKETNEFHVGGARRPAGAAAKGGEGFDASMRPIPNSNSNRKHN